MELNKVSVPFYENIEEQMFVNIPEYSKILDIILNNSYLDIIYTCPEYSVDDKVIYIYSIDSSSISGSKSISPNYEYFKTISYKRNKLVSSLTDLNTGINLDLIESDKNYLIFIDYNKTISENREEKLNNIL